MEYHTDDDHPIASEQVNELYNPLLEGVTHVPLAEQLRGARAQVGMDNDSDDATVATNNDASPLAQRPPFTAGSKPATRASQSEGSQRNAENAYAFFGIEPEDPFSQSMPVLWSSLSHLNQQQPHQQPSPFQFPSRKSESREERDPLHYEQAVLA